MPALTGGETDLHSVQFRGAIPLFMSEIEAMGGAERSMLALGRYLHGKGRPVYLLTYFDRVGMQQSAGFPLPEVVLHPAGGFRAKLAALRRHFATAPADHLPPITSGYQPALHASMVPLPRFHCLMHDTPSLFGGEAASVQQRLRFAVSNWRIGRAFRKNGGAMIVTSEFLQRDCRRDFGVAAQIARMGGLAEGLSFRRRPVAGALRMLSVCRIEENKRIDWMLDSLAALEREPVPLSSKVDWRLDLAGKGSLLESMRQRVGELGLQQRVHLHGFVPDEELETFYGQAHLFLMPAVQGYGIPAIEALQRGVPVLLHRDSGVSDLLLATPWASVLTGGREEMTPKLGGMISWLISNEQMRVPPPPPLPTEESWAEQVATLCGYV